MEARTTDTKSNILVKLNETYLVIPVVVELLFFIVIFIVIFMLYCKLIFHCKDKED